jgi:phosphomannomutase
MNSPPDPRTTHAAPATEPTYRCPGESQSISRAIHLGRMSTGYQGCAQCEHRHETATLAPRRVRRLEQIWTRRRTLSLVADEGLTGIAANDLSPAVVRKVAVGLGITLRKIHADAAQAPVVALGGDGRLLTAPLLAAATEGVRWTGCHAFDAGALPAPALVCAIDHWQLAGGLLLGNATPQSHMASVKLWLGTQPVSVNHGLEEILAAGQRHTDRPTRRYGSVRRHDARTPYLAMLGEHYHALRPLRLVVASRSRPAAECLEQLVSRVACEVIAASGSHALPGQVVDEAAHFGFEINDDGEVGRLFDQQGREVPAERLLAFLARHVATQRPEVPVVLDAHAAPALREALRRMNLPTVVAGHTRSQMAASLREHGALLGGGPNGRFWYHAGYPTADALRTLTWLVVLLSRSDRPLTYVLDAEAPLD